MIGKRLSHYRIVEQIGAGGMGVVYRAHDEQLDRDVAVKVLPAGSLADDAAHKRFRKEALSLACLNHPNVATVHEFGSQDGTYFLVTEYIAGITLDAKLAAGPLAPNEVIRLGSQLAAGLEAAHQQGIVHRDLKPGNLRITVDGRLKILDFGLAQFEPRPSEMGLTATMTQSQETSGTLPYMAPEQLSGEIADARTDIWAAGAVLYEMATGKRPFSQTVPALLINAILNQPPGPASKLNPAVPAILDQIIAQALARDPAYRYQSAATLQADLDRASTPTASVSVSTSTKRNRSWLIYASLVLILVLSLIGGYSFLHKIPLNNVAKTANHRRAVAVLGFKDLSSNPEKSWLSTALSELLTTELSQGGELRTIPGESIALMKASLALPDADSFSPQTLTRIRQNLGSDVVIVGSYLPLGNGQLRLDVRIQDTLAGEILASVSEKGSEAEIDSLVSKAGSELRARLGIRSLSSEQYAMVRASLPASPEAARLYSEGLQRLRLFDALTARDLLQKASSLSPEHAPTHSALAEAWSKLGYEGKAREQAKRAFDLSSNFSREERLLIEGRSHELMGEPPEAIENYRALWTLFPDRVDYGLLLIRAQIDGGRASDAQSTLSALRQIPLSEAEIARADLADAAIAISLSDFKRCQSAADRAASRGRAIGANLLVAEALRIEADATERMGDSQKTIELLNESRRLCNAAGYRQGAARTLLMEGDLLFDQGDFVRAKAKFDEALPVFREIGDQRRIRGSIERLGNVYYGQGKLREAEASYKQALRIDQDFKDPTGLAGDYGNLANTLDGLGDLPGALKMQQQALNAFNEIGDRRGASATLNNLGNLSVEMGKLEKARKYFEQSLALSSEISYRRGEPYPLSGSADVLFAQGDLSSARHAYEQALALCAEVQDEDFAGQIRTSLALIALEQNRLAEGASLARQAAATFDKTNSSGSGAWSHAVLARILLRSGDLAGAQREAEKSVSLSQQTTSQPPRFESILADARVKANAGKLPEAREKLRSAIASAHRFGYLLSEYQLRLALGEISAASPAARSDLSALEKEARNQGAILVADQARSLLRESPNQSK